MEFKIGTKKHAKQYLKFLFSMSLALLLSISLAQSANATEASFNVAPQSGSFEIARTFSVDVFINSDGASINAAQAKINFPSEILRVVSISKSNSIFSLWVQEPVWSNSNGEISFAGGLPSPGFKGRVGKVITIFFQGKIVDTATVNFKDEVILENSAKGTNLFSFSQEGNYSIVSKVGLPEIPAAPEINSSTHPDSNEWYSNNNPEFQWELTPDIIEIGIAFNQKPFFNPGDTSQAIFSSKTFAKVMDGAWYFHLKLRNEFGWSKASHFRIQIDTQPPHSFDIIIDNEGDATNPFPLLYFETKDALSSVDYYEIKIGEGDTFKIFQMESNPFRMPHQAPGLHDVSVKAVDKAQNFTESRAEVKVESIPTPEITVCPSVFVSGEEVMHIEGTAMPGSQVLIFFKKEGKLVKKWEMSSDQKGEWFLEETDLFKSGMYEITARTKDGRGAVSNPSKPYLVKVTLSGFAIGFLIISYKILTLLLFVILLIVLICVFYLFSKAKRTRNLIEQETEDLKHKFCKEYSELYDCVQVELKELKKVRGDRKITKEERRREQELLKNLADVREVLEKELKDIEDIK